MRVEYKVCDIPVPVPTACPFWTAPLPAPPAFADPGATNEGKSIRTLWLV